jgi:hypothetical protein
MKAFLFLIAQLSVFTFGTEISSLRDILANKDTTARQNGFCKIIQNHDVWNEDNLNWNEVIGAVSEALISSDSKLSGCARKALEALPNTRIHGKEYAWSDSSAKILRDRVVPELRKDLASDLTKDYSNDFDSFWKLGMIGHPAADALPDLINCLQKNLRRSSSCASTIAAIGFTSPETIEKLTNIALTVGSQASFEVLKLLGTKAAPAAKALLAAIHKGDAKSEMAYTLWSISERDRTSLTKEAYKLLKNPNSNARRIGSKILFLQMYVISRAETVPHLIPVLDDSDHEVVTDALYVLDQFGPDAKDALPKLLKMLQEPLPWAVLNKDNGQESYYRGWIARIVAKIGGPRPDIIDALISALVANSQNKKRLGVGNFRELISGFSMAFGSMGPPAAKAIPVLEKLAEEAKEMPDDRSAHEKQWALEWPMSSVVAAIKKIRNAANTNPSSEAATPQLTGSPSAKGVFSGTIGSGEVWVRLDETADGVITGTYFYKKKGVDIPLKGKRSNWGVEIEESDGLWKGRINRDQGSSGNINGKWVSRKGKRSLEFSLFKTEEGGWEYDLEKPLKNVGKAWQASGQKYWHVWHTSKSHPSIQLPFLTNFEDAKIEKRVNASIENELNNRGCKRSSGWETTAVVTYADNDIFSIRISDNWFCPGTAHPSHDFKPLTFDLKTGEMISFEKLFTNYTKQKNIILRKVFEGYIRNDKNPSTDETTERCPDKIDLEQLQFPVFFVGAGKIIVWTTSLQNCDFPVVLNPKSFIDYAPKDGIISRLAK